MKQIRIKIIKGETKCSCCKKKVNNEFGYLFHEDCFEKLLKELREEKCNN